MFNLGHHGGNNLFGKRPWCTLVTQVPLGCLQQGSTCSLQVEILVLEATLEQIPFSWILSLVVSPQEILFTTKFNALLPVSMCPMKDFQAYDTAPLSVD